MEILMCVNIILTIVVLIVYRNLHKDIKAIKHAIERDKKILMLMESIK